MYVLACEAIINGAETEFYFYRRKDNKPQVFTFETPAAAEKCLKLFQSFAIENIMKSAGGGDFNQHMEQLSMIPAIGSFCSSFELKECPKMECELVSFEEIMKEKGIEI